ncbi:trypsin-like peptidase domain-containing protein [Variovorax boronicumulans]|uniref:trypsin-like peptidase domain-containing protein n=1 Tax=Variovorax boronicumulans TaxID=436515 RepID=UPI00209BE285|nr:trypsin-like peptidase domain-containing protein [Variovorax boronicumulans]PBI95041.1 putative periplasmic serine endoprotease DegP-like precursor [Variovorax boronicumulans]
MALLGLAAAVPLHAAMPWPVPGLAALVKAFGPAVVHIGVERPSVPARRFSDRWLLRAPPAEADESSLGSGFLVSADGLILTNAHVVAHGTQIRVKLPDRREFRARLIGLDALADVALLKIDATGLPTVRIGDPADVEPGDGVAAIGSPYGFGNSVTAGIVSAKGRLLPGAESMQFLQTDVPINPGNSGGPLFNLRGEVIGINSRIYSRSGGYQGLSFAIPIDAAMRIKDQLLATGTVTRGRIGVAVQEVGQALADTFRLPRPAGALVTDVEPRGAAARGGLKTGDVILSVQGREVVQAADALGFIAEQVPGQRARLMVWRDRAEHVVEVKVEGYDTPRLQGDAAAAASVPSRLGFAVRPLAPAERQFLRVEGGLLVQRVNVAASRAGVQPGDVILALNGQPIDSAEALAQALEGADGTAALLVQRAGARIFVPICAQAGSPKC